MSHVNQFVEPAIDVSRIMIVWRWWVWLKVKLKYLGLK